MDHSHMTGRARGVLCSFCNTILGMSFDSPEILRSAAAYLEKHANGVDVPVNGQANGQRRRRR